MASSNTLLPMTHTMASVGTSCEGSGAPSQHGLPGPGQLASCCLATGGVAATAVCSPTRSSH